ncbi:MAG: ferritin family protein [Candidatus Omnitrophica bacterium]|nr:ferritin family protein [Candidatus Omnitrophota bacterium]
MAELNLMEILDMAIEKEKMRRDFYAALTKKFLTGKLHELFVQLEKWEDVHVDMIIKLRDKINQPAPFEFSAGDLEPYWQFLLKDRLHNLISADDFCKKVETPLQALDYAIGFEKDAVLFFSELLNVVEPDFKHIIAKLVDEEKNHVVYLSEQKADY